MDRYFIEETTTISTGTSTATSSSNSASSASSSSSSRGNSSSNNQIVPLSFLSKDTFTECCTLCGHDDHEVFECPHRFCSLCNRKGHESTNCTYRNVSRSNQRGPLTCDWCSKVGHTESKCPMKEFTLDSDAVSEEKLKQWKITKIETSSGYLCCELPQKKNDQIYCFNCGGKRHFGLQCAQPSLASMMNSRSSQNKILEMGVSARSDRTKKIVHHLSSQFLDEGY